MTSNKISFFIENQFPQIYREEGRELIEIVEEYYKFLEIKENQSVYNARRMSKYRNVDTTLDDMIIFFRNKFMSDLQLDADNIRFIIKNIIDLYRRKGSPEGMQLFFELFYQEQVDIYYPSVDMLKISASRWKITRYLQLFPQDNNIFEDIKGKRIFGSLSDAEAYVDNIYYININKSQIPILFLNSVKGNFRGFDDIYSQDPITFHGKVYGSLQQVTDFDFLAGSSGNEVGDLVSIESEYGFGGKGIITEISDEIVGEIDLNLIDGGFGYIYDESTDTLPETDIIISNQTLFVSDDELINLEIGENIRQIRGSDSEEVNAIVVDFDDLNNSIYIKINDFEDFFEIGEIETTDRDSNITQEIILASEFNESAFFEIGDVTNSQEVTVIIDLIEAFLDVPLDSDNFSDPPATVPLSGGDADINTPINEAFVPQDYNLVSLDSLANINKGLSYTSNIGVLVKDNIMTRFNIVDRIITIDPLSIVNINLSSGDIITQERLITNFFGLEETRTITGRIINIEGNNILYVRQLSFNTFVSDLPLFKDDSSTEIIITSISRDGNSRPAGMNAVILSNVEESVGRISRINVTNSGFGYVHRSEVRLKNNSRESSEEFDAVGVAQSRGQGKSDGVWESKESHIGPRDGKRIQDSYYYQDYSYEIGTTLNSDQFLDEYRKVMHPVGTSLFIRFNDISFINNRINIKDNGIEFI